MLDENRPVMRGLSAPWGLNFVPGQWLQSIQIAKGAKFRYNATLEEIIFDSARGKDRDRITQLATCEFIKKGQSVLITGPSGVGKSFLSTALGYQACLDGQQLLDFMELIEDRHARKSTIIL